MEELDEEEEEEEEWSDLEDEDDSELLTLAKKTWSLNNLQPLEILCMKAVVKNFDDFSNSTLLEDLRELKNGLEFVTNFNLRVEISAPTMKSSFLEFLTKLNNNCKRIPLTTEQRLKLIEMLLHETLQKFDFCLLIGQDFEFTDFSQEREFFAKWEAVYARLWTSLAAKCPNLLHIRERWPVHPLSPSRRSKLDEKIFKFSKLISLDTNCSVDSGLSFKTPIVK